MTRLRQSARDSQLEEREVVEMAVAEYLDRQEMELAVVKNGLRPDAGRGLISHEAMKAWLESWGEDDELVPPQPDHARSLP
ncbi:hypothetical protein [Peteryoungia ipomoeae]|uniref:CopG family transcriptional regulator n=1 Tax=Peteryoungia ipomoeae TaxID=1210932 RepID=A0A4S8NV60_9HYPH|nr:hypothetical protein [Peteryoungia ipomoeae]THV21523.1 hypothetical protein FAA97_16050 [Peteryoungia ipomoeae]